MENFALAIAEDWKLGKIEIFTVFFYEEVEENIYIIQPIKLEDRDKKM